LHCGPIALTIGVIDDPGHLLGHQARVDCVDHSTATGDAEVQLKVPVAVPGQGGHAIAEAQLQPIERACDLPRAPCRIGVGVAVDVTLDPARHDRRVVVMSLRELDQPRNQQRLLLHQSQHRLSPRPPRPPPASCGAGHRPRMG
jgi:hypothetical protein